MAVRLSREPGRYSVVLRKPVWVDPALFGGSIAKALSVPRSDAVRMCRLQRGILFEGALQEQAEAVASMLTAEGIESVAVADDGLPLMPKPVHVSLISVDEDGLATPTVVGAGMPKLWRWENLALACGGILIGPDAQSASLVDKVEQDALEEAEDRRSLAGRALEKARDRVFPLREEIDRPEAEVGDAVQAALAGRSGAGRDVAGFGRIDTVADLVFTKPYERLRITGASRATNLPRSTTRARDLHVMAAEFTKRAPGATVPGAMLALAHGTDSGEYVFEDLSQFDAHCRWAYYWRLRRMEEA
jgi:hypothetical protein